MNNINFKNKWVVAISIGIGLILFICIVIPFLREKYLYWRLGYVDIAPVLIQDNDLPNGFTAGNITEIDPYYYESARAKSQDILTVNGSEVGTLSVYLFASTNEQSEMYEIYSHVESQEGIIPYEVTNIGDKSTVFSISGCDIRVLFTRCTAVAVIELYNVCQEEYDFDKLVAHAKRLDESLKSIACY
ncbi:MAG: hypothetical protein KF758_11325 [Anaerolineales bacterium]|nr:hypothetical protein [Anaerolineales bacterium]MBX3037489.1 hypothetical protein [Anaerolineales bacterium]